MKLAYLKPEIDIIQLPAPQSILAASASLFGPQMAGDDGEDGEDGYD